MMGTLSKFADTKLCGVVDTGKGRDAIQRDLIKLKRWALENLMRFTKAKCKVLHWVRVITNMYTDWEKNPLRVAGLRNIRLLVDEKLNTSQKCDH